MRTWDLASGLALLVVVAAVVYLLVSMGRIWFPHDDGAIAQSAVRLLQGQIPHRDFVEIYTGGLTMLHALSFSILGESIQTLRVPLFLSTLVASAAFAVIARQFVGRPAALLAAAAFIVWTVPIYPVPVASWYVGFSALGCVAALIRYEEAANSLWLLGAGLMVALAVLTKLNGALVGLIPLVWLATRWPTRRGRLTFALLGGMSALGYTGIALIQRFSPADLIAFAVPLLVFALVLGTWVSITTENGEVKVVRVSALVAGFVLPVAAFLLWFSYHDAFGALLDGLFTRPLRRLEGASAPFVDWRSVLIPAIVSLFVAIARARRALPIAAIVACAALTTGWLPASYRAVWFTVRWGLPILGIWMAFRVLQSRSVRPAELLILSLAVGLNLLQFPFSTPVYFLYGYSAVLLMLLVVLRRFKAAPGSIHIVLLLLVAYGGVWMGGGTLDDLGATSSSVETIELNIERLGVRVPESDAFYSDLIQEVRAADAGGGRVLVYGDAPEVHFLANVRNPTPDLFEFLGHRGNPPDVATDIAAFSPRLVVVNTRLEFSEFLKSSDFALLESVAERRQAIGRFEFYWLRAPSGR